MAKEEIVCEPQGATPDETWEAVEHIMRLLAHGPLLKALNIIRYNGHHIKRNIRSIAIKERSKESEIILRGKWLQREGFEPAGKIWVLPFSEVLIIIPQGPKK